MHILTSATTAAVLLLASPSLAMDAFEIQVYQGEHSDPGQASAELHSNYTLRGRATPAYEGETPPDQALRFTLEPALGIARWLELGAYLQTMITPDHGAQFGGWKLRAKFIAPSAFDGRLLLGINVEVGRVPASVEKAGWANEFRPIVSLDLGRFAFTLNPLFGFALSGPEAGRPDFEPAAKAKWNTDLGFAAGFEHYAGLGRFDQGFLSASAQEHLTFLAFDLEPPTGAPFIAEVHAG